MAYIVTKKCIECYNDYIVNVNDHLMPSKCHDCVKFENKNKEDFHIKACKKLTIDEHIEKIERWIYNHKDKSDVLNIPLY